MSKHAITLTMQYEEDMEVIQTVCLVVDTDNIDDKPAMAIQQGSMRVLSVSVDNTDPKTGEILKQKED